MAYRQLFILIEGDDDERFFQRVVLSRLKEKYDHINLYKYAQRSSDAVGRFLRSVRAMKADYIITGDIDKMPCISQKKENLTTGKMRKLAVPGEHIAVVVKEIEGWYMAGLDEEALKKLGIKKYKKQHTNDLTKEEFNRFVGGKFISRIDLMQEILKLFNVETARRKNQSLDYFMKKYASPDSEKS
jgi:hypothetical protein